MVRIESTCRIISHVRDRKGLPAGETERTKKTQQKNGLWIDYVYVSISSPTLLEVAFVKQQYRREGK